MAKANGSEVLETAPGGLPLVALQGLNTNQNVNFSGTQVDTSGNITFASGAGLGVASAGTAPTVFHTGNVGVNATTGLTQKQIVTTESYLAEVFIPASTTITGISILNGHTTSASQNMFVGLANSAGTIVAKSNTTTAQAAADAYQQIPFTATYSAVGPAKYYVVVQGSATTGYIATSALGNYGATKVTSETYGTFLTTASYSTTTFTTGLGPVADTY